MSIPDYERMMLPLLRFYGDKQEHSMREAIEYMSQLFRLSEEEKRRQAIIDAIQHLEWAGLLESTKRGFFERTFKTKRGNFRITNRGLEVLKQNPSEISMRYLLDLKREEVLKYEEVPIYVKILAYVIMAGLFIWVVGSILQTPPLGIPFPWNWIGAVLLFPVPILFFVLLAYVGVSQDTEEKIAGLIFLALAILIIAIIFYMPDLFQGLPDIIQLILVVAAIFSFAMGLGFFGIGTH